jgi:hypothetical protein
MKYFWLATFSAVLALSSACADQVVMQNGDVLHGTVLAADTNAVTLQNDNLGDVVLSRSKVASITFGTASPAVVASLTNAENSSVLQTNVDLSAALRGLQADTNLVQEVQSQILGSSNPEAVKKFNDLLNGLSTGQIDMNSLRQQAQSEVDELRSFKKDLGSEDTGEIDSYLAILDDFLQQTATNSGGTLSQTNSMP